MPFFAVYALLFADAGATDRQISLLFVVWSVVAIVAEIPSGAWADLVSRRRLLILAALLYAACFAVWVLVPTLWGFALGFVLWAVSGALSSGTFVAFAYDELAAVGRQALFGRVVAWGASLALLAVTLATLTAAPLLAVGGYPLVGWASVTVCLLQVALVVSMPESPRRVAAADVDDVDDRTAPPDLPRPPAGAGWWRQWWATMRAGVAQAHQDRVLRGGVLASAVLMGLAAFDEYFGLLLRGQGVATTMIPVLLTAVAAAQAVGALLAERAQTWPGPLVGWLVAGAGIAMAAGAFTRHPVGVVGVAAGFGLLTLLLVVSQIRLQHITPSHLRATVTSVSNVLAEVLAVGVFVVFALGADLGVGPLVGVLCLGLVLLAPAVAHWLPDARQ